MPGNATLLIANKIKGFKISQIVESNYLKRDNFQNEKILANGLSDFIKLRSQGRLTLK